MSFGPALYLWTHRLTSADVVSVVTTTLPFTATGIAASAGTTSGAVTQTCGSSGAARTASPVDRSFVALDSKYAEIASNRSSTILHPFKV